MIKREGKEYIIYWNNTFPFDRWWREKWKVPMFSKQHLETDPISQVLEYIEDKEFELMSKKIKLEIEKEDRLKTTGRLINNVNSVTFSNDDFENLDIGNIYNNIETE